MLRAFCCLNNRLRDCFQMKLNSFAKQRLFKVLPQFANTYNSDEQLRSGFGAQGGRRYNSERA
ncbi:MAG: hypothetical protein COB40_08660 [Marinosulfonomonas sp.]|nr:MAG: hypothetical protein COB40_08660 [Marinosulfonomonas sp.]